MHCRVRRALYTAAELSGKLTRSLKRFPKLVLAPAMEVKTVEVLRAFPSKLFLSSHTVSTYSRILDSALDAIPSPTPTKCLGLPESLRGRTRHPLASDS